MRLKQLTINNFGIYKNQSTFTFPYSQDNKVSLIIGDNGAGKTTFLNAFKICLFGSMVLKNSTITKNYTDYIMNKLNKDALKESSSEFSIEATFISQIHNYDGEFKILRKWDVNKTFRETVIMKRNGSLLNRDEQVSFTNALYHAFPLDLFELFYLDGEKIDQLSVLNSNIYTLLESSINIDLFKKLKVDLETYASKRISNKEIDKITTRKTDLEFKKNGLLELVRSKQIDLEITQNQLDSKAEEIYNLRNSININNESIDYAELKKVEYRIVVLKQDIEKELTKFLPYTLVTDQLDDLRSKLVHEFTQSKNTTITQALNSNELSEYLGLNNQTNEASSLISKIVAFYPTDGNNLVHKLSDDDYYSLKEKITKLIDYNKTQLQNKIKELQKLESKYAKMSSEATELETLKSAGQLDHLLSLQNEYGNLESLLTSYDESLLNNRTELNILETELIALEKELWKQVKNSNISNVLDQIHSVLNDYIYQIKSIKVQAIEQHTKIMFDKLIHKDGFIRDFRLQNDEIYLLDKNNNRLNHTNLSAGEKQLFVLSLLYAVLQSSERKVPLMFDTLLGRLDEKHRDNVIKEFISSCPNQVIILATDSELVNLNKEYLSSITNIAYCIDYNETKHQIKEVSIQ